MCGISGVLSLRGESGGVLLERVRRMNHSQALRGPDGEGSVICGENDLRKVQVAFGHRRLSIIDLSKKGNQPMKRGSLTITFNGEIYNFQELKKELESKKVTFKTNSDTEVILALFEAEGEKSFSRLRGMFAFGLWDDKRGILYLVRDRFGIKPLYYGTYGAGGVVFASSVQAIKESGALALTKNSSAFIGLLLFGSVPLPLTTWNEVSMVPEGSFLEISRDGHQKVTRYYSALPFFQEPFERSESYLLKTERILQNAVDAHLISDAPLGVFLSGGLDSSALAILAARSRKKPITTVSVTFDEENFSEEPYQRLVSDAIRSEHHNLKVRKSDFFDALTDVFESMDQPTIDGINTYFIARAAKTVGLKTVLSGLGSDEIFLGYQNFKRARMLRVLQNVPLLHSFSWLPGKYRRLSFLGTGEILGWYLAFRGIFTPREAAKIAGVSEWEVVELIKELEVQIFGSDIKYFSAMHPVQLLSFLEMKLYMQNQLLKDSDFMAMRHSIEIRVPFVDHRVIEHVARIAPDIKLKGDCNKPVLIEALKEKIPARIYKRKKMGFTFPLEAWLQDERVMKRENIESIDMESHWSRRWLLHVFRNRAS